MTDDNAEKENDNGNNNHIDENTMFPRKTAHFGWRVGVSW